MLLTGLRAQRIFITVGIFPDDLILFDRIQTLSGGGQVAQQHFAPSAANLAYLDKFRVPLVIHLRDPRAVMVSWTHHLSCAKGGMDELFWYYPAICPPAEFLRREFAWRLQWCIEHHLPHFLHWIESWCVAIDRGRVRALLTTYEQFVSERSAFLERILAYAGIPRAQFVDPQSAPGEQHLFRTGHIDEWRSVLDAATQQRMTAAIPRGLLDRFGWGLSS